QLPNAGRVPTSAPCPALLTGPTLIFDSFRPKRRTREPLKEPPARKLMKTHNRHFLRFSNSRQFRQTFAFSLFELVRKGW
ncbi:MAG: hypothetical protein NTX13_07810, partial [Acidobacteria bacterium]|nr:hypothetical protein [Acidobacteriota bacterium]